MEGVTFIKTLADAFKLGHHSSQKLRKYESLVYNEEQEISEINQTVDISKDIGRTGNIKNQIKCTKQDQ